jgi:hypothetical protein
MEISEKPMTNLLHQPGFAGVSVADLLVLRESFHHQTNPNLLMAICLTIVNNKQEFLFFRKL